MPELNYPLLKSVKVNNSLINFLNKKFDFYIQNIKEQGQVDKAYNNFSNGFQTPNLLLWQDKEFKNFLNNEILNLLCKKFFFKKEQIKYKWVHMLEYESGGKMEAHRHMHNEDFVFFIYLNSCKSSGETVFYLNNFDENSLKRTKISVLPKKNLGLCFSSLLVHEGFESHEDKRIFVVGFRLS